MTTVFYHRNKKVTNQEVGAREWAVALKNLTMVYLKKYGGVWMIAMVECYKQSLLGHCSRSLEDWSAESSSKYRILAEGLSESNNSITTGLESIPVILQQRL